MTNKLSRQLAKYKNYDLNKPGTYADLINTLEAKLNVNLDSQYEGARVRARADHLTGTDKCTSYFIRKEKLHAAKKLIKSLKNFGILSSQDDIQAKCFSYYSDL